MGDRFKDLSEQHIEFIGKQHLYFVSTAGAEGHVNLSPKGMDSFRVIDNTRVAWLNLTGSGNETAAHVSENGRMTVMFCSFDKQPLILRLYGQAKVLHPRDEGWGALSQLFPDYVSARQIFDLRIELVQGSCGYAVPYYEHQGERPTLANWAEKKGKEGVEEYWKERNTVSLDNRDTGILDTTEG
ncbi:MAG: pyridoxamine 5'-phosphate oxidase family protein [Halioglobus sp.]